MLRIHEAAGVAQVSEPTIRRWIRYGLQGVHLAAVKRGKFILIDDENLQNFLEVISTPVACRLTPATSPLPFLSRADRALHNEAMRKLAARRKRKKEIKED
ncbi:MAG: helix-turn-helix domain-containing protein [Planctomycetaceae bacterium]|jgi:hypothetical protein|nr:helix-turn-helix domain-containing protein [Planctomycetaceae bacterium]